MTERATRKIKGLEDQKILDEHKFIRDVRPFWIQLLDPFKLRPVSYCCMVGYIVVSFAMPGLSFFLLLLGTIHFMIFYFEYRYERLPMRLPITAKKKDYSDPLPGREKYRKGEGSIYIGTSVKTMAQMWASLRDALTHFLIFGTTGSGKTEILLGIAFSGLLTGGGFFYIDPKASTKLPMQIFLMLRILGRDDDFRVLNYNTGTKKKTGHIKKRTSNTENPFKFGSAEPLTQLLVSLIPKSEGDNAIFSQNAQTLATALMFALVELRDKHGYELNINVIRKHMSLAEFVKLARRKDLSQATRDALNSFLASVGWQPDKGTEADPLLGQPRSFAEQFGYARSYFGLPLASLTDTYGSLYNTELGEVDKYDIIMSRRVCVAMLPTMETSPQEIENLGKISLSGVKNACAVGLGDGQIEGTVEDRLESLPVDSTSIFFSITDEYESIPTPGYADVFTQARSLGVSGVCATQSWGGMTGADEKGAQKIAENTKIKMISTVESGQGTWDFAEKMSGGNAKVLQSDGYHIPIIANRGNSQGGGISYKDQGQAKVTEMRRVPLHDLQTQIEGEFHLYFRGKVERGESFYTNIPLNSQLQMRVHHMAKIIPIDEVKFQKTLDLVESFKKMIVSPPEVQCTLTEHHQITQFLEKSGDIQDQCIATLINLDSENKPQPEVESDFESNLQEPENLDDLKAEAQEQMAAMADEIVNSTASKDAFISVVIDDEGADRTSTIEEGITDWMNVNFTPDLVEIEKKTGATMQEAMETTGNLIVETANNSIPIPPEPPLPLGQDHAKVKESLLKIIDDDFGSKFS